MKNIEDVLKDALVKDAVQVKLPEEKTTEDGDDSRKIRIQDGEDDELILVKYTGLYDLSDPKAYNPQREKYKRKKEDKGGYGFISVYMKKDEQEHLKKLAAKYRMSMAAVVRMLIANSK